MHTYPPKSGGVEPKWYPVDAADVVLGRLATHVTTLFRGRHEPTYAPYFDGSDYVIVINASKVVPTSSRLGQKSAHHHSGYPGGLRATSHAELLAKHPERVIVKAVRGVLPENRLGREQLAKLKAYAGTEHPHAGQKPETFELKKIVQRAFRNRTY